MAPSNLKSSQSDVINRTVSPSITHTLQRNLSTRSARKRSLVVPDVSQPKHASFRSRNGSHSRVASYNIRPIEATLPGSKQVVLAMPGSTSVTLLENMKRASFLSGPADSLLSYSASDLLHSLIHPRLLYFKNHVTEEAYRTSRRNKNVLKKLITLGIVLGSLKLLLQMDIFVFLSAGERNYTVVVLECIILCQCLSLMVIGHIFSEKQWAYNVSMANIILLLIIQGTSMGLNHQQKIMVQANFELYAVLCANFQLLPFQFRHVIFFMLLLAVSFFITLGVTKSTSIENCDRYFFFTSASIFFIYFVSLAQFRHTEIQNRELFAKDLTQQHLARKNNSLKAQVELDQGYSSAKEGVGTLLEGVVADLSTLEHDLRGTGNNSAAQVVETLVHELATSGKNLFAPKLVKISGLYDSADFQTGGYLDLMFSRHGYASNTRSSAPSNSRDSASNEVLTVGNEPYRRMHNLGLAKSRAESSGLTNAGNRRATAAAVVQHKKSKGQESGNTHPVAAWPLEISSFRKRMPALQGRMHDWNFGSGGIFSPPEECKGHELLSVMQYSFSYYGLFSRLEVIPSIFTRYFSAVEELYNPVTYHNRLHAADVAHSSFWFLSEAEVDRKPNITMNTIFSILVGAAIHDVAHPGQGNTFQVNMETQIALIFNDMHVLENMHLYTAFELMRQPKMNIMGNFQGSDRKEIRQYIVDAVIGTDLTLHFENLAKFKTAMDTNAFDLSQSESVTELVSIIIHAADVASPAKDWPIYRIWIDRVFHEFLEQGDLEIQNKIVPAPLMSREQSVPPKAQIGFINFFVLPLFEVLEVYTAKCKQPNDHLRFNSDKLTEWEANFDRTYCYELKDRSDLCPPPAGSKSQFSESFQNTFTMFDTMKYSKRGAKELESVGGKSETEEDTGSSFSVSSVPKETQNRTFSVPIAKVSKD